MLATYQISSKQLFSKALLTRAMFKSGGLGKLQALLTRARIESEGVGKHGEGAIKT